MEALPLYQFMPLKNRRDFRLVELNAGTDTHEVVCRIEQIEVPDKIPPGREGEAYQRHQGRSSTPPPGTPPYEALSYTWVGELVPIRIAVERSEQRRFMVHKNLETALRQLRYSWKGRKMWIDAICINQDDSLEKDHQVANMARIYRHARTVCVWLGGYAANSDLAFRHIRVMLNLDDFDKLISNPDREIVDAWDALFTLLRRRWFSRRWVVQEIALAKQAMVYCGTESASWNDFSMAVQLFATSAKAINNLFKQSKNHDHDHGYLGSVSAIGAVRLVQIARNILKSSKNETPDKGPENLLTLEELVTSLTEFDSLNPRDSVYSVLALAKDVIARPLERQDSSALADQARPGSSEKRTRSVSDTDANVPSSQPKRSRLSVTANHGTVPVSQPQSAHVPTPASSPQHIESETLISNASMLRARKVLRVLRENLDRKRILVDYEKPISLVYKDFMELALNSSIHEADHNPLDIICRPWAPALPRDLKKKDALPSWMRKITDTPFGKQPRRESLGMNWYHVRQNADPLVGPAGKKRQLYSASKAYPVGVKFDQLSANILVVDGFVFDQVEALSETCAGGVVTQDWLQFGGWIDEHDPEGFPDCLWRTLIGDRDLSGEPVQSLYRLAFKHVTMGRHTELMPFRILSGRPPKAVVDFLERMEAVIWRRRLIRTKETESLGLGHKDMRVGDLVCILFGCSVPIVLRAIEDPQSPSKSYYHVIGECYIHGIMDGEAFDKPREYRKFQLK